MVARLSFVGIKLLPGLAHREIGIRLSSSEMGDAARVWRHRTGEITLDRTRVMGILNVTPDSFSDAGRYFDPDAALRHGLEMVEQGADLLDVGGESTRPGSDPVSADEEWRRVCPRNRALPAKLAAPLSRDTTTPHDIGKAVKGRASLATELFGLTGRAMCQVRTMTRGEPGERLSGSIAAATLAVAKGAHVVRVHDVRETVRAMRVADAVLRGEKL